MYLPVLIISVRIERGRGRPSRSRLIRVSVLESRTCKLSGFVVRVAGCSRAAVGAREHHHLEYEVVRSQGLAVLQGVAVLRVLERGR